MKPNLQHKRSLNFKIEFKVLHKLVQDQIIRLSGLEVDQDSLDHSLDQESGSKSVDQDNVEYLQPKPLKRLGLVKKNSWIPDEEVK
jgi:hypothetical protein